MLSRGRLKIICTSSVVAMMCLFGLVSFANYQTPPQESLGDGADIQQTQYQLSQHQLIIHLLEQQSEILDELRAVKLQLAKIQSTNQQDVIPKDLNAQSIQHSGSHLSDSELEQQEINQFLSLRNSVLSEKKDMDWARKMEATLAQLPTNLKAMRFHHTKIVSKNCRTSACVVEFLHSQTYDTSLFSAAIEVPDIAGVLLRDFDEHGNTKTVAILKR